MLSSISELILQSGLNACTSLAIHLRDLYSIRNPYVLDLLLADVLFAFAFAICYSLFRIR
jgi:hypothetical protein